jgi:hypothetical protein
VSQNLLTVVASSQKRVTHFISLGVRGGCRIHDAANNFCFLGVADCQQNSLYNVLFAGSDSDEKYMALAIVASHPETTLNAENRMASQTAALLTSFPTIMRCASIRTPVALVDWFKIGTLDEI